MIGFARGWALTAIACAAPAVASAQMIATDLPAAGAAGPVVTVTLTWPQPTAVTVEAPAGELVLRFDQAVSYEAFAALAPRLGRWVASMFTGYDSVVLQLAPGATGEARAEGGRVVVRLTATGEAAGSADPPPAAEAGRRLRLLKAALLWATGDPWQASELLRQLAAEDPDNPDVRSARALVDARLDRWRLAAALYAAAGGDRGPLPARGSDHSPRATAEVVHDDQGGVGRLGARVHGHGFAAPGVRLGAAWEGARVGGDDFNHHGALRLRHDALSGSWWSAGAGWDARNRQPYGGAEAALWDPAGLTRLGAGWAEPRWDLPALARIGAARDAVSLARTVRAWPALGAALGGDVSGQIQLAVERWHGDGATQRAWSAQASLQVSSWRTRPRWTVGWSAWHFDPVGAPAAGALGAVLGRGQVHTATAGAGVPLWRWLSVDGWAGYAASVWGDSAVQFGGSLQWAPPVGLRASLRYGRALVPGVAAGALASATLHVGGVF